MTQSNTSKSESSNQAKLPTRDWILLPSIGLITICLMAVSSELVARHMFTHANSGPEKCLVLNDRSTGPRGIPGCKCWEKIDESQEPVEYRFNHSGYRADVEFGPKPPDAYRVVLVGGSVALGGRIPIEKAFPTLLSTVLSQRTGRKVEILNEAMAGYGATPHTVALHLNESLASKPDMLLWILLPFNIQHISGKMPDEAESIWVRGGGESLLRRTGRIMSAEFTARLPKDAIIDIFRHSRSVFVLRHFLYESQSQYVKSYLMQGEDADFLRTEPNEELQKELKQFDGDAAEIEARAASSGVPVVVVMVPNRAQAAMISMGKWPAGYDPYMLGNELRPIIASHGGTYVDILTDYRHIPNPEQGYFPIDGHPNIDGHATITAILAKELTNGSVPALRAADLPHASQESER